MSKDTVSVNGSLPVIFWFPSWRSVGSKFGLSKGEVPVKFCEWVSLFINAGIPKVGLSPSLVVLHINGMLEISAIHCYVADSTGHVCHSGRANISQEIVIELTVEIDLCLKLRTL